MKSHNCVIGILRIGLLILLVISSVQVVSASSRIVPSGGVVYIGETNLDITNCVHGDMIGWWPNPYAINVTSPTKTVPIINIQSFFIDPSEFTGYTGTWYNVNPTTMRADGVAFLVVDSLPIANDDNYIVTKNTALKVRSNGVLLNDYDPAGDILTAVKVTSPVHGKVILNTDGTFTYTPVKGYTGTDTFTYKANDGISDSNIAKVTLTIRQANTHH
jgi:hypothetical protein